MKNILTFILLIAFSIRVNSQFIEKYLGDKEPEPGKIIVSLMDSSFVYYGGVTYDNYGEQPVFRKIDTLGNVLWSTTDFDTVFPSYSYPFKLHASNDGALYAANATELWKISKLTGAILFRRSLPSSASNIIDYSANRLLVSYVSSYNGSYYSTDFALIDKVTGNTDSTYSLVTVPWQSDQYVVTTDTSFAIYATAVDSIFKLNGNDFSDTLWKVKVGNSIRHFSHLQYSEQDTALYLFGRKNTVFERGVVAKVNAQTGIVKWVFTMSASEDVDFSAMQIVGNYIYVNWKHIYVGGHNTPLITNKINKNSGVASWESLQFFDPGAGGQNASYQLKLDDNEDIYLTGYYGSANYGPGSWGIMKLNGGNGNKLYSSLIPAPTEVQHGFSEGIDIFPMDGKVIAIGTLEKWSGQAAETWVEIDPADGRLLTTKFLGGKYIFPSITTHIDKFSDGKILVLGQRGRHCAITVTDNSGNIYLDTLLSEGFGLSPTAVKVVDDTSFIMATFVHDHFLDFTSNFENHDNTSILYRISKGGNIINKAYLFLEEEEKGPVNILYDHAGDFFYTLTEDIDNGNFIRKINGSSTFRNLYWHRVYYSSSNYLIDYSPVSFLYIASNAVLELSKQDLSIIRNKTINPFNFYHANVHADSIILACGDSGIAALDFNTLDTLWGKSLPTIGRGIKWVNGESDSSIYILSTNGNLVNVSKFSLNDKSLVWTKTITDTNQLAYVNDIAFNHNGNFIAVTGYYGTGGDSSVMFISFLDTMGNIASNLVRDGEFSGSNMGLYVLANNNTTIVGGSYTRLAEGTSAFIYYFNSDVVSFPCQASYELFPDTIPHHYYAVNQAWGTPPLSYSWDWGDGNIDNIPFPSHTYDTAGFYNICLSIVDSTGCTHTSCNPHNLMKTSNAIIEVNVILPLNTGVTASSFAELLLFPNPASDYLTVELPNQNSKTDYKIFNMLGELKLSSRSTGQKTNIDVSGLINGVYILELRASKIITRQKFIKE